MRNYNRLRLVELVKYNAKWTFIIVVILIDTLFFALFVLLSTLPLLAFFKVRDLKSGGLQSSNPDRPSQSSHATPIAPH